MIEFLLEEIEKALNNDIYFSPLLICLALIDICAKAEYKNMKVGERYKNWFDKYMTPYKYPEENIYEKYPYINGECAYMLRCKLLHEGTTKLNIDKIKNENSKINKIILTIEPKNDWEIYVDVAGASTDFSNNLTREYSLNIRRFCNIATFVIKDYYTKNKNKFDFIKNDITYIDEYGKYKNTSIKA